jgi:glyoxylase I family protein
MPRIAGQIVILTVTDVDRSAAWYCDLLGMDETGRYVQPDGHLAQVCLAEQFSGVELCLVDHQSRQATFDEFQIGLDHLELDTWVARLDELGIPHSGVKEPPYTANAMVTFRDPDNIQLEFFWRLPRQ